MPDITPTRRPPIVQLAPAFVVYGLLVSWFIDFTAEDAFIVYRYARQFTAGKGLVFNAGEPVTALTSPLHAIICCLLEAFTGRVVTANKWLWLGVLPVCFGLTAWISPPNRWNWAAIGLVALASPMLALWTVGGLETPLVCSLALLLFAASRRLDGGPSLKWAVASSLSAGVLVLARHDAVLFAAPVIVASLLKLSPASRRWLLRGALLGPASLLVGGWLIFAWFYYGDILPTSFYTKPPGADLPRAFYNAIYIGQLAVLSLVGPWLVAIVLRVARRPATRRAAVNSAVEHAGVWIGIGLLVSYGLLTVTTHMMFSHRMLIPYLPVLAMLVADLAATVRAATATGPTGFKAWLTGGLLIICWQLALGWYLDHQSLNPGWIGEYQQVSAGQYQQFIQVLNRQAEAIREDWPLRPPSAERPPRIFTYAAGVIPFRLQSAYIIDGNLISYRHAFRDRPSGAKHSADYFVVLYPRNGALGSQLGRPPDSMHLVTETSVMFDGELQRFAVYYNPSPISMRLPSRIVSR